MKVGRIRRHLRPIVTISSTAAVMVMLLVGGQDLALESIARVSITDSGYVPDEVEIPVNGTVIWRNIGQLWHTVTSVDGLFDSGILDPLGGTESPWTYGQHWRWTFNASGTYEYYCRRHPGFQERGRVIVIGENATPTPTPTLGPTPTQPLNLTAEAGIGQVFLTWEAPAWSGYTITEYRIYRGESSTEKTLLASTPGINSYTDTTVLGDVAYYYDVTAVNLAGESPPSNEATATPTSPPTPTPTPTHRPTTTTSTTIVITPTPSPEPTTTLTTTTAVPYESSGILVATGILSAVAAARRAKSRRHRDS